MAGLRVGVINWPTLWLLLIQKSITLARVSVFYLCKNGKVEAVTEQTPGPLHGWQISHRNGGLFTVSHTQQSILSMLPRRPHMSTNCLQIKIHDLENKKRLQNATRHKLFLSKLTGVCTGWLLSGPSTEVEANSSCLMLHCQVQSTNDNHHSNVFVEMYLSFSVPCLCK